MSKVRSRKHSYGKIYCFGTIGNPRILFSTDPYLLHKIQFCAATSNSQQSHTYPCQTTTITPGQQQAAPSISYPIYPRSPAPPKKQPQNTSSSQSPFSSLPSHYALPQPNSIGATVRSIYQTRLYSALRFVVRKGVRQVQS